MRHLTHSFLTKTTLVLFTAILISGCDETSLQGLTGGGLGNNPPPVATENDKNNPKPNQAPTANAGDDKTVEVNTAVTITGSGSDSDGRIVSYLWKEGSTILARSASFSYTPTSAGRHTLKLTVTDDDGAKGYDSMVVTATETPENQAPTANAGDDKTVEVNTAVTITGSGSDSDGRIVSYLWKEGSTVLARSASFDYTPTSVGDHTLTLTVKDNDGATARDSMTVTATAPVVANQAPTANAGDDKTVEVNTAVTITGSGSDSDGRIVSYLWKEGSTILARSASFSYTPTTTGKHRLTLTVTDDDGATAYDSMTVTATAPVVANQAPTANAGDDKTVEVNTAVTITGSGSDSDGRIVSYLWKEGSTILARSASFDYTPTSAGRHTLKLTVTDDDGAKGYDSMVVTATETPENQAPTANAGDDKTVEVNTAVTITGSGSDSDGRIVSYLWKEGSKTLAKKASFDYTPTSVGDHILTLTVTDNDGAQAGDSMIVTATETNNGGDDNGNGNNAGIVRKQPLLVVAIEFSNYNFGNDFKKWHDKFFGSNREGQLNHYYNEISQGTFEFVPAKETYGTKNDGIVRIKFNYRHPDPGQNLFKDNVNAVKKIDKYIDFSQYDKNGDGHISRDELQIMLLFAGGESAYGDRPGVWAMQTCLHSNEAPNLDGVDLMRCKDNGTYSRFGQHHGNHDATIGIIAHELGHAVFDLPDLYDTDNSSSGIGNFGLMGGGSWNRQQGEDPGATPVHMTGWSKVKAGFIEPKTITNHNNLALEAAASKDFVLYKIPTNRENEYFLIANRASLGYDRGFYELDGRVHQGGLLILHIDDNLWPDCRNSNDCNNKERHKLVDVVEANNPELDSGNGRGTATNFFYEGNKDKFTPSTNPSSNQYNGSNSGVSVTGISKRGNVMRATIKKN